MDLIYLLKATPFGVEVVGRLCSQSWYDYRSRCPQVYHLPTPWNRGFSGCRFSECSWVNVKERGIELNNVPWTSIFCWTLDFENSKEFLREKWYDSVWSIPLHNFLYVKNYSWKWKMGPFKTIVSCTMSTSMIVGHRETLSSFTLGRSFHLTQIYQLGQFHIRLHKGYLVPGGTPQFW